MEKLSLEIFNLESLPQAQTQRVVGGTSTAGSTRTSGTDANTTQVSYSHDDSNGTKYNWKYTDDNGRNLAVENG